MNWEAIGAIGEILAAVAVVMTLIYLARQIRQNSMAVEIAALRDTTEQWNRWSEAVATSADLAEIYARGNRSYRQLSEVEAIRYGAYVQMFFDCAESYRLLVLEHQVQKDLDVLNSIVRRRIRMTGIAEWWAENRQDYSADFAAWIDSLKTSEENPAQGTR